MNLLVLLGLVIGQVLPATFSTVRDVPLPGDTSRFDYVTLEPTSQRLFIAHLGAGTVPVYDIASGTIVGDVQNVPGVHGTLAVPERGRVYVSATDSKQVATIPLGGERGNTQYDATAHRIIAAVQTRAQTRWCQSIRKRTRSPANTTHQAATIHMVCRSHQTVNGVYRLRKQRQTHRHGLANHVCR